MPSRQLSETGPASPSPVVGLRLRLTRPTGPTTGPTKAKGEDKDERPKTLDPRSSRG